MISEQFKKDLEEVINRHSMENGSDTPDWILAGYLIDCLLSWNMAIKDRDKWHSGGVLSLNLELNANEQDDK